jgi:hypothetical protein
MCLKVHLLAIRTMCTYYYMAQGSETECKEDLTKKKEGRK